MANSKTRKKAFRAAERDAKSKPLMQSSMARPFSSPQRASKRKTLPVRLHVNRLHRPFHSATLVAVGQAGTGSTLRVAGKPLFTLSTWQAWFLFTLKRCTSLGRNSTPLRDLKFELDLLFIKSRTPSCWFSLEGETNITIERNGGKIVLSRRGRRRKTIKTNTRMRRFTTKWMADFWRNAT